MLPIRDAIPADNDQILVLNNAAVPAVNPHTADSLVELLDMADRAWVVDDAGTLGGLLVAFAPGATYQSRYYKRLSERYDNFAYVDRIVVAETHRRLGLAGRLYAELAAHASAAGRHQLLCEVNVEPPNPQSIAFHTADGWLTIEDHAHGPGEVVRYFEKPL
jgi:predicted GNAT superfamily acetyltransferase